MNILKLNLSTSPISSCAVSCHPSDEPAFWTGIRRKKKNYTIPVNREVYYFLGTKTNKDLKRRKSLSDE
jgi:hypothetical protein